MSKAGSASWESEAGEVEVGQMRLAIDAQRSRAWRGKLVVESWWCALGVGSWGLEVGQVRLEVGT